MTVLKSSNNIEKQRLLDTFNDLGITYLYSDKVTPFELGIAEIEMGEFGHKIKFPISDRIKRHYDFFSLLVVSYIIFLFGTRGESEKFVGTIDSFGNFTARID